MLKKNILAQKILLVLGVYIKTQFVVILLVTFISWSVLSLLGVEHALLLGLITGSASIAPIVGLVISAIIASLVAIFDSSRFLPTVPAVLEGLVILVLYGILNILVDYILSPYLIGKSTKIHPVLLLLAIIFGAFAFGFLGALLAVPALLVIKTILEHEKH